MSLHYSCSLENSAFYIHVALASGHIFGPVPKLLAITPFTIPSPGQLSNPPVTLPKIYTKEEVWRGGKSFAVIYYLIFHSFICLRATFLSQPVLSSPHTSKQLYLKIWWGGGEKSNLFSSIQIGGLLKINIKKIKAPWDLCHADVTKLSKNWVQFPDYLQIILSVLSNLLVSWNKVVIHMLTAFP